MTKQQKLIGLIGVVTITGVGYAAISNILWSNAESPQTYMNTNVQPGEAQQGAGEKLAPTISDSSVSAASQDLEEPKNDEYRASINSNTVSISGIGIERELDSDDGDSDQALSAASPSIVTSSITKSRADKAEELASDSQAETGSAADGSVVRANSATFIRNNSLAKSTTGQAAKTTATGSATISRDIVSSEADTADRPINIASTRPTVGNLPPPISPSMAPAAKIVFTSPLPMVGSTTSYTNSANAIVAGSVVLTKNLRNVTVNGQAVNWRSGTFTANVPLQDGFNTINAVADYGRPSYTVQMGVTLDTVKPTAISAISTDFNTVRMQFNEPMGNETSTDITNFSIVNSVTNTHLPVTAVSFADAAHTAVLLQTGAQNNANYTITANNVKDLAGNTILEPQLLVPNPSSVTFVGTPPTGNQFADFDGDGLLDHIELHGWPVVIQRADGSTETYNVSSDPLLADTDDDGVADNEERHAGIDPRNIDTDGDILTDNEEWNIINSDPANQDTDGDGTQDGFEFYSFRTSPSLADTDGDQISDTDEVIARNRDPRIADLPSHGIRIGEMRLQIDERYTYEDVDGLVVTNESSSNVALTSNESAFENSGSTAFVEGMFEIAFGRSREHDDTFPPGVPNFYEITAGVNGGRSWSTEIGSATESQRVREESLAKARQIDTTSTVTREIVGASIGADVTIENRGDLAFSITNLEITVLQRSRESTRRFVPVATLIANSTLTTGEPATFNLGPFTPERGPILFSSRDVFPNLVDELMQMPTGGLIFEVVNYDIVDEYGRLFTYSNQESRDLTGAIVIDSGDGQIVRNLVATALQPDPDGYGGTPGNFVGGFKADGSPLGIPLDFALQDIMELTKNGSVNDGIVAGLNQVADSIAQGDDVQLIPPFTTGVSVGSIVISAGANGVLDSVPFADDMADVTTGYETSLTCNATSLNARAICSTNTDCDRIVVGDQAGGCSGPETLTRFGSLRTGDFDRQWVVLTSRAIPAGAEFGEITVAPGENLFFAFIQDLDQDGIFAREEFFAGSTDSRADNFLNASFGNVGTQGADGFPLTAATPGSDGMPDSKDTDRDGLGDFAEIRVGWKVSADGGLLQQVYPSPRLPDSDGDGLLDPQEQDLRSFCMVSDPREDALCSYLSHPAVSQEDAIAIIAGLNGEADSIAINDDEQLVPSGETGLTFATPTIGPGADGILDSVLADDDEYQSVVSSLRIPPASNPILSDTDLDEIEDFTELTGFTVGISIRDSSNEFADTTAIGDDLQQTYLGGPVFPGGIVVLPGPNGIIDSCGPPLALVDLQTCSGDDQYNDGDIVATDPLRRDTDGDLVSDGRELAIGGDPTDGNDGGEFRDSDQDGLRDAEESILGWLVTVNGGTPYQVLSNPSRPDSDFDGLPDFAERVLHTDPNKADTDGDGLLDFDEIAGTDFEQFFGLDQQFPNFFINGANSMQYGTSPNQIDTDGDLLTDHFEVAEGYRVLIGGESGFRQIYTNPLVTDTDLDGAGDYDERWGNVGFPAGVTDATDPDTDDDGRNDGLEDSFNTDPLEPDVGVTITYRNLFLEKVTDAGGSGGAELTWVFNIKAPQDSPTLYPQGKTVSNVDDFWTPVLGDAKENQLLIPGDTTICVEAAPGSWDPAHPCIYDHNTWIPVARISPIHNYALPIDKSRSFSLKRGEEATVHGVIYEADGVPAGYGPNLVPSAIASGCLTRWSETFVYEDFENGGTVSIPIPDGKGTAENCEWTIEIDVRGN